MTAPRPPAERKDNWLGYEWMKLTRYVRPPAGMPEKFGVFGSPLFKIIDFQALEGRRARITWHTGEQSELDLSAALNSSVFERVRESDELYRLATINEFGDAVVWEDAELAAAWIQVLADQQGVLPVWSDKPLPRIASFEALAARRARLSWTTGQVFEVDLTPALAARRIFRSVLVEDEVFRHGVINEDRNAITWGDDAVLSAIWIERLAEQQGTLKRSHD